MATDCGHKVPCGCKDTAFASAPPCNDTGNCAGEPCAEVFCVECIQQCQPDYLQSIGGNDFIVTQGLSVHAMFQKLLIFLEDGACALTAVLGLRVLSKTDTTIKIAWDLQQIADTHQIFWTDGVTPGNQVVVAAVDSYQLSGLLPDTEYTIYVNHVTSGCSSVSMTVKTNA